MLKFVKDVIDKIDRYNQVNLLEFNPIDKIEIFECKLPQGWQNYTYLIEQKGDYIVKRECDFSAIYDIVFELYCQQVPSYVQNYLKERGIDKTMKAGFVGNVNLLTNKYKNNPIMIRALFDIGLIKLGDWGTYDHFKNRVIFPVYNGNGKIKGLIGRLLPNSPNSNSKAPKYLNSEFLKSENIWFTHKGCSFDRTYVSEGLLDSQMVGQVFRCDSSYILGSSISLQQFQELTLEYENIFFIFDGDEAGKKASDVVEKLAIEYLNYYPSFYTTEYIEKLRIASQHSYFDKANIFIKELPMGKDPCELGYDLLSNYSTLTFFG